MNASRFATWGRSGGAVAALVFVAASACSSPDQHAPLAGSVLSATPPTRVVAAVTAATIAPIPPLPVGDAERGGALVLKYECNRCHEGTGHAPMPLEQHCVRCHDDISTGHFGAGTPRIATWKERVAPYRYVPSLDGVKARFDPSWLSHFLSEPEDLRPHLDASMPRLGMSPSDANDIAAYLTRGAAPSAPSGPSAPEAYVDALAAGNPQRGRASMEAKACGGCHEFTGVPPLPARPNAADPVESRRKAVLLAPDLRHTRDRFRRDALVAWLLDPPSMKPDTPMPSHGFTREEATDVAAYIVRVELTAPVVAKVEPRLPVLTRAVSYSEVEARVLAVTCRHCHGDPDVAGGDGGPGNTGGFGFTPRRLDLSTYRSAGSGYLANDHQRHSIFEKTRDGTPLLVAALDARRYEEVGQPVTGIRGMPLGLPAVSREDVQLVETWIAQGRSR